MNAGRWEIDIHGYYSLVKIILVPIGTCKNNQRIWRHNASTPCSHDITDLLWWRHKAKSEKNILSDNCKMRDRWLFLVELWVQVKQCVRNNIIHSLLWITIFGSLVMQLANDFYLWLRHSWKSLLNCLTRDTKIIIHRNSCIIFYIFQVWSESDQ